MRAESKVLVTGELGPTKKRSQSSRRFRGVSVLRSYLVACVHSPETAAWGGGDRLAPDT